MTSFETASARMNKGLRIAAAVSLPAILLCGAAQAEPSAAEAARQEAWRGAIARTPVPHEGCFRASYPGTVWKEVVCVAAPARPYLPRHGARAETVGNGNDYAAVTTKIQTTAVGSFPTVTGVKTEKDGGASNVYSLQLNSGFMNTAVCNSSTTGECQSWQQYVYSSSETAAFMQYWLINYGNTCPSGGWMQYEGSCYKNSAAVGVPKIAITQLANLKVTGKAVSGGTDTMILTDATEAYTTTGKDSVVDLATAWKQSEFNVVGDGGGSEAVFNSGSSVTVQIALTDGATTAPKCEADDGTTGETNNLTLGSCTVSSGSTPSIKFTEKN